MMIALTAAPPQVFKRMLELHGLLVIEDTPYHWGFFWPVKKEIISLPKQGQLVSMRVSENICGKLGIDLPVFIDLYNRATAPQPAGKHLDPNP